MKILDKAGIVSQTLKLFKDIYTSDKFINGVKIFLFNYGCSQNLEETLAFIENKITFIFVEKGEFCGMCGLAGVIYISLAYMKKVLNVDSPKN